MHSLFQLLLLSLLLTLGSSSLFAQQKAPKVQTATFTVTGVCGMCKERIENAALIKGVKSAEWDKQTQILTVIYKTSATDENTIHQAVASHGHDTELVKASDEVYKKLPACCAYRDGVKVH